jgi:acetyl esterase/lipase
MRIRRRDMAFGLTTAAMLAGRASPVRADGVDPALLARVDPELRAGAQTLLSRPPLTWARDQLPALRAVPPLETPVSTASAAVERLEAPGRPGHPDVAFELIGRREGRRNRPAIIHIHGGGFILGRASDSTALCQSLADEFDCVVANVDYRLAPETTFPGPMEDCYAVLAWVHDQADVLGADPGRVAVMGASAGGGLAAMVAIAARDRGVHPVCYQVLIYPMLDDRTGATVSVPPFIGAILWTPAGNRFGWTSFLGMPAGSASTPYGASPARLETFSGLAPAFVGVGGLDLFVDENLQYARRLVAAGVQTRFHLTPGAYHGFDFIAPEAQASKAFTAAWKAGLRAAFGSGSTGSG